MKKSLLIIFVLTLSFAGYGKDNESLPRTEFGFPKILEENKWESQIVYDTINNTVKNQYLSLAGTLVNCSGGPTPWNTWISCEEKVKSKSQLISLI